MSETTTEFTGDDAMLSLQEVNQAAANAEELVHEIEQESEKAGIATINRDLKQKLARDRAKTEREKGKANLKKRHAGVSAIVRVVKINERVAGAAFERFFHTIEDGVYNIQKNGERFVGKDALKVILDQLEKRVVKMEESIRADLAGSETQLSVIQSADNFMKPTYTAPAAQHEVEFRTKLSLRLMELFLGHDRVIMNLQALHWNGAVEASEIEKQEKRLKGELRELTKFVSKSLNAMRNKVEVKIDSPEAAAEPAANPVAEKVAA